MKKHLLTLIIGASLSTGLMAKNVDKATMLKEMNNQINMFESQAKKFNDMIVALKNMRSCIQVNNFKTENDLQKKCIKEFNQVQTVGNSL